MIENLQEVNLTPSKHWLIMTSNIIGVLSLIAVIAFGAVLGFVLAAAGLVAGILGKDKSDKKGRQGHHFALIGIALNIMTIVVFALMVIGTMVLLWQI